MLLTLEFPLSLNTLDQTRVILLKKDFKSYHEQG